MKKNKILSIVTVNKNSGRNFFITYQSINKLLLKENNIEWLILDCISSDESGAIIKDIKNSKKYKNIRVLIERDNGIYNAMNKALDLTTGKHILFINSGDTVFHKNIKSILQENYHSGCTIICGYEKERINFIFYIIEMLFIKLENIFKLRMPSSHNSIIYSADSIKRNKFIEHFKFGADYEQYLSLLKYKHTLIYKLKSKITRINSKGYIAKNKIKSYKDYININKLNSKYLGYFYWKLRLFILNIFKAFNK